MESAVVVSSKIVGVSFASLLMPIEFQSAVVAEHRPLLTDVATDQTASQ
jgi:hypothetical protein